MRGLAGEDAKTNEDDMFSLKVKKEISLKNFILISSTTQNFVTLLSSGLMRLFSKSSSNIQVKRSSVANVKLMMNEKNDEERADDGETNNKE